MISFMQFSIQSYTADIFVLKIDDLSLCTEI